MMKRTDLSMLLGEGPAAVSEREASRWLTMFEDRGPRAERERYSISRGLAVLPMRGVLSKRSMWADWMGWATYESVEMAMRDLAANADVESIVLDVDSPGGAAYGCAAAASAIAVAAKIKPVRAYVDSMAASAAYWLVSQASEIIVSRGAALGSIGVLASLSKPVQPSSSGEQRYEIVSTHAPDKRPDPDTEDGLAGIQREVDALEAAFVNDVAQGRGVSVETVHRDFGRGGILMDQDAVSAGMANRVAGRADFYDSIRGASLRRPPRRSALAQAALAQARARL